MDIEHDGPWLTLLQIMVYTGSVGMVFCIMMISLCRSFWQFLLAQGVLLGVSMALSTWPMIALVGQYFKRSRAAATGIVIAGSSLGGIIWPIVIDRLLNNTNLGFPWTMRILGFIMIPLMIFSCAAAKSPSRTSTPLETGAQEEKKFDGEDKAAERRAAVKMLLKQPALQLTCLAMFMVYFGLFAPIFYLPSFAAEVGFSTTLAFYTASIVNGASFLGRILPGFVADRYGKFNCCIIATISSSVVILCWTKATSVAGLVIWSAAYGFASGVCPVLCSYQTESILLTRSRASCLSNKRALLSLPLSRPSAWQLAQSQGPHHCRKSSLRYRVPLLLLTTTQCDGQRSHQRCSVRKLRLSCAVNILGCYCTRWRHAPFGGPHSARQAGENDRLEIGKTLRCK